MQLNISVPGVASLRLDARGSVLAAGPGGDDLFGVEAERLIGDSLLTRVHVSDRPQFMCALSDALRGDAARATFRMAANSAAGESRHIWVEARLRRDADEASDSPTALASLSDVSELKAAQARIETVQREAAVTLSLKDRLLANVTHELRTPLNAILGFSEILSNAAIAPAAPEKRFEYACIIHSSAEHLLSVVNLLLDMSRLEAGQFELAPEPFALAPLISSCRDMLSLKAQAKQIEFAALSGHIEINADKRACRQILLNLMSNAVKFSNPGGRISVEARENAGNIEIAVLDEGIGIDAEHLPRIGEAFFQASAGYDRNAEGSGLGLSLVRGLVGLHGGGLTIESAPGVGTRMTVRLPIDFHAAPPAAFADTRFEIIPRLRLAPPDSDAAHQRSQERRIA